MSLWALRALRDLREEIDAANLSDEEREKAIQAYCKLVYILLGKE